VQISGLQGDLICYWIMMNPVIIFRCDATEVLCLFRTAAGLLLLACRRKALVILSNKAIQLQYASLPDSQSRLKMHACMSFRTRSPTLLLEMALFRSRTNNKTVIHSRSSFPSVGLPCFRLVRSMPRWI